MRQTRDLIAIHKDYNVKYTLRDLVTDIITLIGRYLK